MRTIGQMLHWIWQVLCYCAKEKPRTSPLWCGLKINHSCSQRTLSGAQCQNINKEYMSWSLYVFCTVCSGCNQGIFQLVSFADEHALALHSWKWGTPSSTLLSSSSHPFNCVLNFESSEVEKRDTFWFPCSGTKHTNVCALFWEKRENLEKSWLCSVEVVSAWKATLNLGIQNTLGSLAVLLIKSFC